MLLFKGLNTTFKLLSESLTYLDICSLLLTGVNTFCVALTFNLLLKVNCFDKLMPLTLFIYLFILQACNLHISGEYAKKVSVMNDKP